VAGAASDPSVNPTFDNFTFQPVPEPSTMALVGLSVAGLTLARRFKKK
jgi:hypothetical protein